MMKKARLSALVDKLHRGFVWTSISVTLFLGATLLFKGYEYLLYVRPERAAKKSEIEAELLKEGSGFTDTSEQLSA